MSTGLITPFATTLDVPAKRTEFCTMKRRGTWKDDWYANQLPQILCVSSQWFCFLTCHAVSDDRVYESRLRAWRDGTDTAASAVEQAERDDDEDEDDADGEDDDGDEDDNDKDVAVDNVLDEPELHFSDDPVDLEIDLDFDADLRVIDACRECKNTRGLEQLLSVLGKTFEEAAALYSLPQLLRDCRFSVQRAVDLMLSKDEATVRELYPPTQRCGHAAAAQRSTIQSSSRRVKGPTVAKTAVPVALPMPEAVRERGLDARGAEVVFDDTFRIPVDTYNCLFEYQRTGVRWLWCVCVGCCARRVFLLKTVCFSRELHKQHVGGILADEMGLGKSVQVCVVGCVCALLVVRSGTYSRMQLIVFLHGLLHSGLLQQPVLLVCPATVMKQWVSEFHKWAPAFRVIVVHSSKSGGSSASAKEAGLLKVDTHNTHTHTHTHARARANILLLLLLTQHVQAISARGKGVVVTTFEAFRRSTDVMLPYQWSYAVLDEGHKVLIRFDTSGFHYCCVTDASVSCVW